MTFFVALRAGPIPYEVQHYHLSWVLHWIQNQSVVPYITGVEIQNSQAPLSEFVVLHLRLLTTSDAAANPAQYFAMLLSLIAVALMAEVLGGGGREQLMAMIFVATLPVGISQSSAAEADYVVTFFILETVLELVRLLRRGVSAIPGLFAGAAGGLAVLTKLTAPAYILPFGIGTALALVPRLHGAHIYYEVAGAGDPLVMIHAGVADARQWTNEFVFFQHSFHVLRYDLRGYGRSESVEGEFSHIQDLTALLDHVGMTRPLILMGCSMGGGLAMDFALANPSRVQALIMVDAGPSGLTLDVPKHPKADEAEKAYNDGDLDLVAELETQIWFDGMGRTSMQVNPAMRKLAFEMNRRGLELDARGLGKRLPDASTPAAEQLGEIKIPVLIIIGSHDTPYILAAADYMVQKIPTARKVVIQDAAHLPNLDHPEEFRQVVSQFLDEARLGRGTG